MEDTLVLVASLCSLAATVAYGAYLRRFSERSARFGLAGLAVGGLLTLAALVARAIGGRVGADAVTLFLVLSAALSLGWAVRTRVVKGVLPLLGAFIAPVVTMLTYAVHVFDKESGLVPLAEIAVITPIHIAFSLAGFAAFGVAAIGAAVEVVQEYRLKTKRFRLATSGWSLAQIERLSRASLVVAFPLYSIGVALGVIWFARGSGQALTRHAVMASASWILFGLVLYARLAFGLKGRRAAMLTLAAFGCSLFVVLLSTLRVVG